MRSEGRSRARSQGARCRLRRKRDHSVHSMPRQSASLRQRTDPTAGGRAPRLLLPASARTSGGGAHRKSRDPAGAPREPAFAQRIREVRRALGWTARGRLEARSQHASIIRSSGQTGLFGPLQSASLRAVRPMKSTPRKNLTLCKCGKRPGQFCLFFIYHGRRPELSAYGEKGR